MDSDRLIRMLVMDVLHCYSVNTKQFTDWYAFANLTRVKFANFELNSMKIYSSLLFHQHKLWIK